MKISHIYLFLCMNFVATVVASYRTCYNSFSLCLITNTTNDSYYSRNSKFRLTRSSAARWCEDHSSSLAIITNETVQSAVEAFIDDPSAKMVDSLVLTNGLRFNLNDWEWITGVKSTIFPSSDTYRYVYLTVSWDRGYKRTLSDGYPTLEMKFICSYVTNNSSCSAGVRKLGSRCYKFHNTIATWYTARNICLKEESDLATFEDGISSLTSEWIGKYWIGLRKQRWDWLNDHTNYGEIKYSNWGDSYPDSAGGVCLCLKLWAGRWTNCDCSRTYRYICIQDYASGSTSTVTTQRTELTTSTPKVNTTTKKMITTSQIPSTSKQITTTTTTTKLQTTRSTTTSIRKFGDSTSEFHSTPTQTQDDDSRNKLSKNSTFTAESGQTSGFLPFLGIGIACLLILIVVIVVVVFIKNRRSRSSDHEPTNGNSPPPMTYKDDAPSTVYAAVVPNTNDQVYSASEKNSNQTVYAELDLESKRSIGPTQRVSVKVRFTSEETPGQAVYAEVNQVPKENMNEKAEGPSVYDNYNQMMMESVYANSAQTKV